MVDLPRTYRSWYYPGDFSVGNFGDFYTGTNNYAYWCYLFWDCTLGARGIFAASWDCPHVSVEGYSDGNSGFRYCGMARLDPFIPKKEKSLVGNWLSFIYCRRIVARLVGTKTTARSYSATLPDFDCG